MFRKIVLFFVFVFCFGGFALAQGGGSGVGEGSGKGSGNSSAGKCSADVQFTDKNNQSFEILSKRPAQYTDAARINTVQGTVTLRVTFLKTGKIGKIKTVKGLPYGLTQRAIEAAKKICFKPKIVNGKGKDVTKQIQYSFILY